MASNAKLQMRQTILNPLKPLLSIIVLILSANANAERIDRCSDQLPASLRQVVSERFKDYRLPSENDNAREDISWFIKEGGSGCFGVASADFDGDGKKDFIIAITPKAKGDSLVIAALARRSYWKLQRITKWADSRERLFVAVTEPGLFRLTEALDGPGPDDTDPLVCKYDAAIIGAIESWSVTYCRVDQQWKHVQTSD